MIKKSKRTEHWASFWQKNLSNRKILAFFLGANMSVIGQKYKLKLGDDEHKR
jgi:hypothetical protein